MALQQYSLSDDPAQVFKDLDDLRERAGVSRQRMAKYLHTSRAAYYRWVAGEYKPFRMNQMLIAMIDALTYALEDKALPPPEGLKPKERVTYTNQQIIKYLSQF